MGGRAPRGFGHSLPFGHGEFAVPTPDIRTVEGVSTSGASSDPVSVVSHVIAIPLREMYAALWRLGVLVIDD
ncbi:Rv1535 domain-containing protein [Mycolicibacterium psychrotolerans]|uniref:Rv1535 domain-containing protein n=1 Tax=Mycolicibacterium psychrotolerans TaxID=216929 RepID=UPI0038991156